MRASCISPVASAKMIGFGSMTDPGFDAAPGPASVRSGRRFVVVHLVELKCLACGRAIGMLEARCCPCVGPVLFQAAGTHTLVSVADWRRLRCAVCGGNVYADEEDTTRVYPGLSKEELDIPRRGRPPKWLVAQRRANPSADEE